MPTLEWIGKDKVVNHHQEVPYRVLERQYSYDEAGQHAEDNGSENMIIHGDNLEALKALLPQYEGKVKCIYIDPPLWGDRIFEKCGIRRDEGGDGGKTLEIRGKRRLSARDGGANYQQS